MGQIPRTWTWPTFHAAGSVKDALSQRTYDALIVNLQQILTQIAERVNIDLAPLLSSQALTSGSVVIVGANGGLTQDAANLSWDSVNHRLGVAQVRIGGASTFFVGTGVPGAGLGANSDFYFRTDGAAGATIYQKRAGAWVATGA